MKYVLEPMLLALSEDCSEKEFKNFVKRIILWDFWMDENPDDVFILSTTEQLLANELAYPVYPTFEKLLDKYDINYVKACDLNQTISKLLKKAKKIDKNGDVSIADNAILSEIKISIDSEGKPVEVEKSNAFNDLMWHIYCRCQTRAEKPESYIVFTKGLSQNLDIDVEYQTIIEGEDDFVGNTGHAKVRCHSSLKDFFKNADSPFAILKHQQCKDDLSLAIKVAIYQKANLPKVMDAMNNYKFTIQDSFYSDFCEAHYSSNSTIMNRLTDEMSNVVLNLHYENREDFRTGIGGNNPQLKHGNFCAWRWFITRSVKMMYWQKDSHYKFANVKEHNLFECHWEDFK